MLYMRSRRRTAQGVYPCCRTGECYGLQLFRGWLCHRYPESGETLPHREDPDTYSYEFHITSSSLTIYYI